jgi:hypothetical protein
MPTPPPTKCVLTSVEIPKNLKGKKEFLETLAYAKKAGRYP